MSKKEELTTDELSLNDNLDYLVNSVYKPFIVKKVVVKHLLSQMECMRSISPDLYKGHDVETSANIFLEHLKTVKDPGKYVQFKLALEVAGYESIVAALENKDVTDDENYVKIIEIFCSQIVNSIEPSILAEKCLAENLITQDQLQEIKNVDSQKNQMDAAFLLLTAVPRRHSEWFPIFLKVLHSCGYKLLVEQLDDKYYLSQQQTSVNYSYDSTPLLSLEGGDIGADFKSKPEQSRASLSEAFLSNEGNDIQKELSDLRALMEKQQILLLNINSKVERLEQILLERNADKTS